MMTIGQLQSLLTTALAQGLTIADQVFGQNDTNALAANAQVPMAAGNEIIALGTYQASSGSAVATNLPRGLYIGLAS